MISKNADFHDDISDNILEPARYKKNIHCSMLVKIYFVHLQ
jgi:hypothetical protein